MFSFSSIEIVIISIILIIGITFILIARHLEKKDWNNGYCPSCGEPWRHFDNDSQGGRGYCCDKCNRHVWISYKVDIRKDSQKYL